MEELVFRWGLWRLWKLLWNNGNKQQPSNESDSDDSRFLSRRWVIVSSILFSAVHIGNHLPVPSVDEVTLIFPRKEITNLSSQLDKHARDWFMSFMFGLHDYFLRYRPIIFAMFQCQVTYVMGHLYCVLYITHGIWAAIGAHFAWNVFACTLPFQIPLRLLIRMIRNAKERRGRKKAHDD